ncbi:MAG: rod shape-determining protein MreC [Proteobacteria bacterium]|nr:rod shape-determining protein MreC [Pseudomonadota bacterium]
MSFFRRFRDATLCVALLAMPFFFLNANLKDPSKVNLLDRVLLQASAPIQYLATQMALGVSSVWEDYIHLVDLRRDNERLRAENARLRELGHRLRGKARENARLRRLLDLRRQLRGELLSAQVIGKEVSPFFRVMRIRLDRGDRNRVLPGMPVLSDEGLVGQVRRSFGHYSDVLLTADRTSAIDVVIERTGARGMLKGTGGNRSYRCRIEQMLRGEDAVVGDLVVTSGLGQRFPAGIVVGRVSEVVRKHTGMYQGVTVTPAVRFSQLEVVGVLTEGSREQRARGDGARASAAR